jgi:hydroxyacylglutathione hydrolase
VRARKGVVVKRNAVIAVLVALLLAAGASACGGGARNPSTRAVTGVSTTSHGYEVTQFIVGTLEENTYLLVDVRSKKGLVIDPGGRIEGLEARVRSQGVRVVGVLNTHGHFDHIGANAYYRKLYGVEAYAASGDFALYRTQAGVDPENAPTKELPAQGDLNVDGVQMRVIPTPGHTPGSVCFLVGNVLFSGDTLFKGDVGRTGDDAAAGQLISSIESGLMALPPDTLAFGGHGDPTTIGQERQSNPYLSSRQNR